MWLAIAFQSVVTLTLELTSSATHVITGFSALLRLDWLHKCSNSSHIECDVSERLLHSSVWCKLVSLRESGGDKFMSKYCSLGQGSDNILPRGYRSLSVA